MSTLVMAIAAQQKLRSNERTNKQREKKKITTSFQCQYKGHVLQTVEQYLNYIRKTTRMHLQELCVALKSCQTIESSSENAILPYKKGSDLSV